MSFDRHIPEDEKSQGETPAFDPIGDVYNALELSSVRIASSFETLLDYKGNLEREKNRLLEQLHSVETTLEATDVKLRAFETLRTHFNDIDNNFRNDLSQDRPGPVPTNGLLSGPFKPYDPTAR